MMNLAELDFQKILVWVLIWLFGYVLGLLENWVKNRSKNKKEEVKIIEAPPKLIEEDYALAVFEKGEDIHLKLGRTPIPNENELNEEQRKRLISLIVRLRPWIEGGKTPTKPSSPSQARPKPAPVVQATSTSAQTHISSQPITTQELPEDSAYSTLNMVGQIDWILQRKLEHHPLKAKNIRLENTITGGLQFCVGDEVFEFIDEIPYPDIKAIIEEARSEWETKSTPGL